jgi:hypothetical protein
VTAIASLDLGRDRFGAILEPGGIAAFAISELVAQESQPVDVLPDLREVGDVVYASRPVAVEADEDSLTVVRLRQVVGPDGTLEESHDPITLDLMDRDSLTAELDAAGLRVTRTIEVPETDRHIASVILVCE